jgi:transposase-like protein
MARAGPRKVQAYSREFKLTAVRLSQQPGIQVQAVAAALDIPPVHALEVAQAGAGGAAAGAGPRSPGPAGAGGPAVAGAGTGACAAAGGARPPKKSHPVLFRRPKEIFAFIATQVARYPVTRLCALYGVTPAGFYAWRRRAESAHAAQDRKLTQQITAIFRTIAAGTAVRGSGRNSGRPAGG